MCTHVGVRLEHARTVEKTKMTLPTICGMSSALGAMELGVLRVLGVTGNGGGSGEMEHTAGRVGGLESWRESGGR